jgi:hypothetical protein
MVTIAPLAASDVPDVQRCAADERVQTGTTDYAGPLTDRYGDRKMFTFERQL